MKKIIALILLFSFIPQSASAATVIFLTSGTSFSTPSDWTPTNTIECVGSGGSGRLGTLSSGGGGGGGGAYAGISNLQISGSVSYVISAGAGTDTYFNGVASSSASLSCAGGKSATNTTGAAGGLTANSTGTVKFGGGSGGNQATEVGGAGGGAGGPNGAGNNGTVGNSGGGSGDAGFGGASDSPGKEWNYGAGAGSGGGGSGGSPDLDGSQGGLYGGGGGGGGGQDIDAPGAGGAATGGIIVIQYWPTLSSMIKILGGKTLIQGGRVRIY